MAKQIAVIMGAGNISNQKKLLAGMQMAASEAGCNLFVFTNYIGTKETLESIQASCNIFNLPDFEQFDGVILAANTVYHPIILRKVMEDMAMAQKPMVSIDRVLPGMSCIQIYSYDAEYEMTEHFLYHGYTDIIYLAGPYEGHKEAELRLMGFKDAMEKNGMPFIEENIYVGDFTAESGREIARKLLKAGRRPEAIICGNDEMAIGLMEVLKDAGIQIPQDIKVAGFDNSDTSVLCAPTLTTVDKSQQDMGYKAVYEIMELLAGKDIETYQIPCKMEYRESCGCQPPSASVDVLHGVIDDLKNRHLDQQLDTLRMSDVVRGMTMDFAKTRTVDELVETLKDYVDQIGAEYFYLCLCEREKVFVLPERNIGQNIDILEVNESYTPFMEMAFAYEKGEFRQYDKFYKGLVLPEECRRNNGGKVYIINHIYYQNCCYGYAVCSGLGTNVSGGLYYSMLMQIGVGLENARKLMLLRDAVDRLNSMWCYDNLTYLYNRSGFSYEAKTMMDHFRAEDKNVFIIFMDADGLKQVNDTMGHEAGDLLIRQIGGIVHKNVSGEMLGMRYGGDEFVLFGAFGEKEEYKVDRIIDSIHEDIKEVNDSGRYPFKLSASVGISCWKARDIKSLDGIIEEADQKMYQEKRAKKAAKLTEK